MTDRSVIEYIRHQMRPCQAVRPIEPFLAEHYRSRDVGAYRRTFTWGELPLRERMSDRRTKRDLHGLDENGMVICNPRDREAAHRAEVEGIATEQLNLVTCRKCLARMTRLQRRRAKGR